MDAGTIHNKIQDKLMLSVAMNKMADQRTKAYRFISRTIKDTKVDEGLLDNLIDVTIYAYSKGFRHESDK